MNLAVFKQLSPLWIAVTLIILCFYRSWKIIGRKNQSETSSAATIRRLWKCLSAEKKKPWKDTDLGPTTYLLTAWIERRRPVASRHGAHVTELSADLDLRSSRSAVTEWKEVHYGCNRSTQLVTCVLNSGVFVFVFYSFVSLVQNEGWKRRSFGQRWNMMQSSWAKKWNWLIALQVNVLGPS